MPFISGGGGSGGIATLTAADTSVVVAGTATAKTVRTNTLDVIAADHAPAADWSNNSHKITGLALASAGTDAASLANTLDQFGAPAANVAFGSHKITGLANGSAATDAAAFGQLPAAVQPWPAKSFLTAVVGILSHSGGTASGQNTLYAIRVIIPVAGTLAGLACNVTASSGNYDIGVFDTSATTRNRLYSKGSTASPGTGWRELGTPGLTVAAGDHLDLCIVADNNTFAIDFADAGGTGGFGTLPANYLVSPLGGSPKPWWFASASFPIPSTIAESSLTVTNGSVPIIIGRIT